jgi:pimeloyl-ACP methyl ester carboxylesterase
MTEVSGTTSPDRIASFRRGQLRFEVVDSGPIAGEAVVLLHGFPRGAESWEQMTERLNAAGYRTLAPDQRGYSRGARPRGRDAYAIDELVDDVIALADGAGLERYHVIGHDWGGFVAWHLAARREPRLQSLTVLSTPHPRALRAALTRGVQLLRSWYAFAWQLPVLPERVLTAGHGAVLRKALELSGLPSNLAASTTEKMIEPGALTAALNWYRAAGRRPGELFEVDDVVVPTLYVWSTNDPALGRTAAIHTASHVAAPYRFEVLDGVSHWIPETEPDAAVGLFLDTHAG